MAPEVVRHFSKSQKYLLSLGGIFAFPLMHLFCRLLLKYFCPSMSKGVKFRISTRLVSALQSLIVVCLAARTVLICNDILRDEDPFLHAYVWFGISYFPYDVIMMYIGYRYTQKFIENEKKHTGYIKSFLFFFKKECIMVLHHFVFLLIGFPVVEFYKKGLGDFFVGCFFLAEISTPFYSFRGILKEIGIHNGRIFEVNGIVFMITFMLGRVLSVPFMYWKYADFAGLSLYQVPLKIPFKCNLISLGFVALQCYWFTLICIRVTRHLRFKKSFYGEISSQIANQNSVNGDLFCHGNQRINKYK